MGKVATGYTSSKVEHAVTEEEINAVFERWWQEAKAHPEEFATEKELEDGIETVENGRYFLDLLAAIRCGRLGMAL